MPRSRSPYLPHTGSAESPLTLGLASAIASHPSSKALQAARRDGFTAKSLVPRADVWLRGTHSPAEHRKGHPSVPAPSGAVSPLLPDKVPNTQMAHRQKERYFSFQEKNTLFINK